MERERFQLSCLHVTNSLLLLGLLKLLGLLLVDLQTGIIGVDDPLDQSELFGCLCLALDKLEKERFRKVLAARPGFGFFQVA